MAMAPQSQRIDRLFVLFLTFIFAVFANQDYVLVNTGDGGSMLAPDNRKPALYTRDFGDCLGNSTLNVTRFDAAYYRDNMTVMFHLQGNSQVTEEKLMSKHCLSSDMYEELTPNQCTSASLHMASHDSI